MILQQHKPPHPGALIQRTYIEPFNEMTGNKVADRLGVARSTFNRLLNGVSDVSPEMAIRYSKSEYRRFLFVPYIYFNMR